MPWSFATLNPQLFGSVIPVCKQPVTTLALDRCPLGRAVLDLPLRLGAHAPKTPLDERKGYHACTSRFGRVTTCKIQQQREQDA